jgi:hypothetical protein
VEAFARAWLGFQSQLVKAMIIIRSNHPSMPDNEGPYVDVDPARIGLHHLPNLDIKEMKKLASSTGLLRQMLLTDPAMALGDEGRARKSGGGPKQRAPKPKPAKGPADNRQAAGGGGQGVASARQPRKMGGKAQEEQQSRWCAYTAADCKFYKSLAGCHNIHDQQQEVQAKGAKAATAKPKPTPASATGSSAAPTADP